jgi:dihydrodiol dehydrogenase / D-xylose 1-dehydrogenase (NADP)
LAVGSRTVDSAAKFAGKYNIPRSYGSYEELVQDPDVDAVYVATPHPMHKENVMLALQAGKAVLCEKPFTVNSQELEELISYAREHKLFLMEAMWTRFLPPIVKVREWLESGRIGEVRLVKVVCSTKHSAVEHCWIQASIPSPSPPWYWVQSQRRL